MKWAEYAGGRGTGGVADAIRESAAAHLLF